MLRPSGRVVEQVGVRGFVLSPPLAPLAPHQDDHFIRLLKASWGLTEKNPAPVNYRKSASGKVVKAPSAAQTHGNILNWNHASGELEDQVDHDWKITKSTECLTQIKNLDDI